MGRTRELSSLVFRWREPLRAGALTCPDFYYMDSAWVLQASFGPGTCCCSPLDTHMPHSIGKRLSHIALLAKEMQWQWVCDTSELKLQSFCLAWPWPLALSSLSIMRPARPGCMLDLAPSSPHCWCPVGSSYAVFRSGLDSCLWESPKDACPCVRHSLYQSLAVCQPELEQEV